MREISVSPYIPTYIPHPPTCSLAHLDPPRFSLNSHTHSLDPKSMSHAIDTYKNQTPTLGCFALSADGSSLIVAEATRLVKASPPTLPSSSPAPGEKVEVKEKKGEEIGFEIPERFTKDKVNGTERLNDGACDAKGRFW